MFLLTLIVWVFCFLFFVPRFIGTLLIDECDDDKLGVYNSLYSYKCFDPSVLEKISSQCSSRFSLLCSSCSSYPEVFCASSVDCTPKSKAA